MTNFQKLLKELGACSEAREWAGEKSFDEVWQTCKRGDWMLWLAKNVKVHLRPITLAKGHCAELVLHLMTDEHSRNAVAVAIRYGNGEATDDELSDAAAAAAYAAYAAANAATAYAAYAAYAAANAATAANAAFAATAYAADAVYAVYAAANAATADYAVRIETLAKCADICRRDIPAELIKAVYPEI